MRVSFLGPEGTHSGAAVSACDLLRGAVRRPLPTIKAAFLAFASGECEAALLPMENSIEGSVGATLDLLAGPEGARAKIRREVVQPIAHALMGKKGARVDVVLSHPQALAQCADSIAKWFPTARHEPASSTAEAARLVSTRMDAAALAPLEAASLFKLDVLADDVSDEPGNRTRFVLLMSEDEPKPTGHDRTSIVFGLDRDRPGGLHDALGELASRGINLSRIESRPTRRALGEYWFFADLEAHREDPPAKAALSALSKKAGFYRLLGSYPRA